jgi:hypothetical protein
MARHHTRQQRIHEKRALAQYHIFIYTTHLLEAEVAKLVDAPDSKSGGGNTVPVRFRPSVPEEKQRLSGFCP